MNNMQKGFTLIELIVVIVILGILAATALPKFVDLSADAGNAAAQGVAASVSSASSMNYAKKKASGTGSLTLSPVTDICAQSGWSAAVSGVTLTAQTTGSTPTAPTTDTAFNIYSAAAQDCSTSGATKSCTIQGKNGTATATIVCP